MIRKCLRLIVSLIAALIVSGTPVLAAEVQDITVTATPLITSGILNFTITYVSDTRLDFDWAYSSGVNKIMIRGKYGGYPNDIPDENTTPSDGYLIYYGSGTSTSDTSVNFDESTGALYVKAWGQRPDGTWETQTSSGFEESAVLTLIALIMLSLGFTVSSYIFKKGMLAFAGAGAWMITGIYCYTRAIAMWDVYYSLFWLFMGLTIASAFSPLAYRETTPKSEEPEDEDAEEIRKEYEEAQKERDKYAFLYSSRHHKRKKLSKFARTGED